MDYWIVYDADLKLHKVVGKRDQDHGLKTFFADRDRRKTEQYLAELYRLPADQRPK